MMGTSAWDSNPSRPRSETETKIQFASQRSLTVGPQAEVEVGGG